jgi:hypothetical protein
MNCIEKWLKINRLAFRGRYDRNSLVLKVLFGFSTQSLTIFTAINFLSKY